ncbi:MAG TPA: carboxypeptidase-like regulatory domain-containing protein [Kofleriaceae bacterium]|nr:carboxypeptidase-like regulatory domain-containing protein [Kofleriaceae bacterium]
MELVPCGGCRRHVALVENACPFCGAAVELRARARPLLGRVSRAAIFGVGASAAAACWTSSSPGTTTTSGGGGDQVSNHGSGQPAGDLPVPTPATGFAALYGVCSNAATGQPLPNTRVELIPGVGAGLKSVMCDSQGRYAVSDLAPGEWNVRFWAPNDPGRMAPTSQFLELKAGDSKRVDGTVDVRDWSNIPMPYGAPPQRRRVV